MKILILGLIGIALTGCANVDSDAGFDDLSRTVQGRTGKKVQWNRGVAQDAEAERAVQELLRKPLTADSAVQVALLNNRDLQATFEEIGIAQADMVEAGLLRNPVFMVDRRFPGQTLEFDVAKEFIDLLLLPLRKRIAAVEFDSVKLHVAYEAIALAAEVRAAFYQNQGDIQLVGMRRTVAEATESAAEIALRMHEAGNIKTLQLAGEQASHTESKLEVAKAQLEAAESREKLNKLMGAWGMQTDWKIDDRLPKLPGREISVSGLESRAIEQRLDLAAALANFNAQTQRLGITGFDAVMEGSEIGVHSERDSEGHTTVGPNISLPIPIFNQGRPASARAQAKLRQSQQRALALSVGIRSDVRAARDRLMLTRSQVEYYQSTALPVRNRVVEESQLEYNAMQIGPFQLLQAKQDEVRAGADSIEALRDYWVARAELEKAVGGNLTGKIITLESPVKTKASKKL